MIFGYARVSKADEQDTLAQVNALKAAGVEKIFEERASGGKWDRPQLQRMLEQLREKDIVVVWKLDRLSRSLKDLLLIMDKIRTAGACFRSLTEHVDTTTSAGHMLMQMLGSFAEFERAMIIERTKAGIEAARARGTRFGRPSKFNPHQKEEIIEMVKSGAKSAHQVARMFDVFPSTIQRIVTKHSV
jgi:DNA invertase Pin-like site-specific DNA recombinase